MLSLQIFEKVYVHPIQTGLRPGEPLGRFLNRFTGKNQVLFHKSKHPIYKNIPHTRWEVYKKYPPYTLGSTSNHDHENCPFSVKPLVTLTYCNSLISSVTNEFYFGILMNETGYESLIDQ